MKFDIVVFNWNGFQFYKCFFMPNALGIMTITAGDYLSEAMFAGKRELADKATLNTLSKRVPVTKIEMKNKPEKLVFDRSRF